MIIEDQPMMKFVPKGWGFEKWIVNNDKYCGKLLYFVKGMKCSLHYHQMKDETFYVHKGKIRVYYSDDVAAVRELVSKVEAEAKEPTVIHHLVSAELTSITLGQGDNLYIPTNRVHQMVALQDTELFEFSTTHRDEDSYRILKGD